jgi:hypothetical protein
MAGRSRGSSTSSWASKHSGLHRAGQRWRGAGLSWRGAGQSWGGPDRAAGGWTRARQGLDILISRGLDILISGSSRAPTREDPRARTCLCGSTRRPHHSDSHCGSVGSQHSEHTLPPHFGRQAKHMRPVQRQYVRHEQADLRLDDLSSSAVSPAARGRRGRSRTGVSHPALSPHQRRALPRAGPSDGAVFGECAASAVVS